MIIENVDWQITSLCNRTCDYCFGPTNIDSLSIEKIYRILDCLALNGVKQLGITGGEPLLNPNIVSIINYAYDKGFKIYLSTNCDYYFEFADLIKEKVSIIGVPIDGASSKTHDLHRGVNSFINITNALFDICKSNSEIRIKIGTVITKKNQDELIEIEKLINHFSSKIIYWKLYEMITYDRNIFGTKKLFCSKPVEKHYLGKFIDKRLIIDDTITIRDRSYFFLKPNGDVFIPKLTQGVSNEHIIGNILEDDFKDIVKRFQGLVNVEGYNNSIRYMRTRQE